ncbi:MAG: glycosyltransferase [bacterium]
MANYNNSKYIEESLNSVISQNSKDWNLIIIDDCSQDNSVQLIKPYLDHKNIKLIQNKENVGYTGTLIKLIDAAETDIVGILDSDDSLKTNAVCEILKCYTKKPELGFVYSQFMYCNSDMTKRNVGYNKKIPKGKSNLHLNKISHFKTFRKNIYNQTTGYDEKLLYSEDKDIIFKLEEFTKPYFLNKILYNYRVLPNSQGNDPTKMLIGQVNFILAKYNAYIRRLNTNLPNLSKIEICNELKKGLETSSKLGDNELKKAIKSRLYKVNE